MKRYLNIHTAKRAYTIATYVWLFLGVVMVTGWLLTW